VLIYSLKKKSSTVVVQLVFLFEEIIEEILPLVLQLYSCVGRERKKNSLGVIKE
jgi:hypothetical protein